jgi:DNA-binding transcriptional ArsR family regulator
MSSRRGWSPTLEVEQIFSSHGRTRIISVLIASGELNVSEIVRRSGVSHSSVARHLEFLVSVGILTEKRFNRIRIFRVNSSSPYTKVLNRFLSDWKSASASVMVERSFN